MDETAGEADTFQVIGPWVVRSTWDRTVSELGPVRVVIEPDPNASPEQLAGGVTSTVLRDVRPSAPARDARDDVEALTASVRAVDHGLTDEYLAALARLYVAVAPVSRGPSVDIGGMLGKPPGTVKNALTQARKRGLLTTIPHRRGGELTDKARQLLDDRRTDVDQVANWPEGDHQRWAAEHNGVTERGTAANADAAHAKSMMSVFRRRREELDDQS